MTGYLHPDYAQSLAEFGSPLALPKSEGWLLQRRIPNSDASDAMGIYPLFYCKNWQQLSADIEALKESLVSVTLVTDPFGDYDENLLRKTFDRVMAFKSHFVIELARDPEEKVSTHHRKYARKVLEKVSVEAIADPMSIYAEWGELFSNLVRRHKLTGIKAFSPLAFQRLFALEGLVILGARHEGRLVGAQLWLVQNEVAVGHIMAINEEGYSLQCTYALYWEAIRLFKGKVKWLNIGGGAGVDADAQKGLTWFKRGWTAETRTAWLCASTLHPEKYAALCASAGVPETNYFPAYRLGEF